MNGLTLVMTANIEDHVVEELKKPTAVMKAATDKGQKEAQEMLATSSKGRAVNSKPSLPLEKFAGVYNDAWYGPILISADFSSTDITRP